MDQPKLEIIRFASEDVIATSVAEPESLLGQSVAPESVVPESGQWG